jgi:hypothetical protein
MEQAQGMESQAASEEVSRQGLEQQLELQGQEHHPLLHHPSLAEEVDPVAVHWNPVPSAGMVLAMYEARALLGLSRGSQPMEPSSWKSTLQ